MAHVDDLIETSAEKIVMPRIWLLFRSHPIPHLEDRQGITQRPKSESKSQEKRRQNTAFLQFRLL